MSDCEHIYVTFLSSSNKLNEWVHKVNWLDNFEWNMRVQINQFLHINCLLSLLMVLGSLIKPGNESADNEEINMWKHLLSALKHVPSVNKHAVNMHERAAVTLKLFLWAQTRHYAILWRTMQNPASRSSHWFRMMALSSWSLTVCKPLSVHMHHKRPLQEMFPSPHRLSEPPS